MALLAGGRSSEHEVSLASARAVGAGLVRAGHELVEIEVGHDGVWRRLGEPVAVLPGRGLLDVDVVFPALHGPFGEDGTVQGLLELADVPYVGSGVLASALCMDKVAFKVLMGAAGVPQVRWAGLTAERWGRDRAGALATLEALGLPLFVKPARLGSSVGIARVAERPQLPAALEAAFAHDGRVIAEAASSGVEVECGVLGWRAPEASAAGEIVLTAPGPGGWYDYEAKYTPGAVEFVVPARIGPSAADRVRELALEVFLRADCAGLARVDFFVEGEHVLVNELNTMPGFTATSGYPRLWQASGLGFPELVDRLVGLALERWRVERAVAF